MDIIDWSYVNRCQIPWRKKKRDAVPARDLFALNMCNTKPPIDTTVAGKTTQAIFDIADMKGQNDVILEYHDTGFTAQISTGAGGHLRPRVWSFPSSPMEHTSNGSQGGSVGDTKPSAEPPH